MSVYREGVDVIYLHKSKSGADDGAQMGMDV